MNLKDAKKLRDKIRGDGTHCIVPLGYGPDGYFARIFVWNEKKNAIVSHDFRNSRTYRAWRQRKMLRRLEAEAAQRRLEFPPPRSPIEMMIDRACGLR